MAGLFYWNILILYAFASCLSGEDAANKSKKSKTQRETTWGKQITSYFIPPETGEYKFYSSCNHICDVYLSENDKISADNLIISQRESVQPNIFEKFPDQASHTIYMQKDNKYFLRAYSPLENENIDSHLSVGVILPDDTKLFPISKPFLRNIIVEKVVSTVEKSKGKQKKKENAPKRNKTVNNNKRILKKLERIEYFVKSLDGKKNERKLLEDPSIGDMMNTLKEYRVGGSDNVKTSFKVTTKESNPFREATQHRLKTRDKMFKYAKKPNKDKKETFTTYDLSYEKSHDLAPQTPSKTSESLKEGWNNLIKTLEANVNEEKSGLLFDDEIKAEHYKSKLEKIKEEINALKREIKGDHSFDEPEVKVLHPVVKNAFKLVKSPSVDTFSGSGDATIPTEKFAEGNLTFDYPASGFEGDVIFDSDETKPEDKNEKFKHKSKDSNHDDTKNKFKLFSTKVHKEVSKNLKKLKIDKESEKLRNQEIKQAKEKLNEMLMKYKNEDSGINTTTSYISFDDTSSGETPNEIVKYPKKSSKRKTTRKLSKSKKINMPKLLTTDPASSISNEKNTKYFSSYSDETLDKVSSDIFTPKGSSSSHGKRDSDSQSENVINVKIVPGDKVVGGTQQTSDDDFQSKFMKTADAFKNLPKQDTMQNLLSTANRKLSNQAFINSFSSEKDMTNTLLGKSDAEEENRYARPDIDNTNINSKMVETSLDDHSPLKSIDNKESKSESEILQVSHPYELQNEKIIPNDEGEKHLTSKESNEEARQVPMTFASLHETVPIKNPLSNEPFHTDQAFVRDPSTEIEKTPPLRGRQNGIITQFDSSVDAHIPEGKEVKALEDTLYKAFEAKFTPRVEEKLYGMKHDVPKMIHNPYKEVTNEELIFKNVPKVENADQYLKKVDSNNLVQPLDSINGENGNGLVQSHENNKGEMYKPIEPQVSSFIKVDTNNLQKVLEDAFTGKFHYSLKDEDTAESKKAREGESLKEQLQETIENAISRSKFQDKSAPEIENAIKLANAAKKSLEMSSSSNFETDKALEKPVTIYRNDRIDDLISISNHSVPLHSQQSLIKPIHDEEETAANNRLIIRDYSKTDSQNDDDNHGLKTVLSEKVPTSNLETFKEFKNPNIISKPELSTEPETKGFEQPKIIHLAYAPDLNEAKMNPTEENLKENSALIQHAYDIGNIDFETGSRHGLVPATENAEEQENYSRKIRELLNQIDIIKQEIISMKRNRVEGKTQKKNLIEQLNQKKRQLNKLRAKKNNVYRPSKKYLIPKYHQHI